MDYALEGISKLRGIAITEIVFGCLAVVGDCYKIFQAKSGGQIGGTVVSLAMGVFLLATGSYGIDVIKKSRDGRLINAGRFRTLSIMNIVLCVLYCINLVVMVTLSLIYVFINVIVIVFLVIAVIINLLCIALTFIAFKISRQNMAIIQTSGSKTKDAGTASGYPMQPPAYTQTYTEVRSSEEA